MSNLDLSALISTCLASPKGSVSISNVQMAEIARDAARFRHIIAGAELFPDPEPSPDPSETRGWSIQWGAWCKQGTDLRAAIDAAMAEK